RDEHIEPVPRGLCISASAPHQLQSTSFCHRAQAVLTGLRLHVHVVCSSFSDSHNATLTRQSLAKRVLNAVLRAMLHRPVCEESSTIPVIKKKIVVGYLRNPDIDDQHPASI